MKAPDVKTLVVVGAGAMGAGIAGEFARAGCRVRLVDTQPVFPDRGMDLVCLARPALIEAELVSKRTGSAALKRVSTHVGLDGACGGVESPSSDRV